MWHIRPPEQLGHLTDVDMSTPPTDAQPLVFNNGSGMWVPGDGGGGTGLITVPEDHGAAGDGSTNDTAALQAWLDDDRPLKWLPDNVYIIDPLDVPSDVVIGGRGTIRMRGQNIGTLGDHAVLQLHGSSGDRVVGVRIYDITVDHNRDAHSGSTSGNKEGIDLNWCRDIVIQGVVVLNAVSDAIDLDNTEDSHIIDCTVRTAGKAGVHLSTLSTRNVIAFNLVDGILDDTGQAQRGGINQVNGAHSNRFIGNEVRNSATRGYQILESGAVFIGNRSVDNTMADDLSGVEDAGGAVTLADTVEAGDAFGLAPAAGASSEVSRADHQHGTPAGTRGQVTIDDPDVDATIDHGLDRTPQPGEVQLTAHADTDGWLDGAATSRFAVSNLDATTFDVVLDQAAGSGKHVTLDWLYQPGRDPDPLAGFTFVVFDTPGLDDFDADAAGVSEVDVLVVAGGGGAGRAGAVAGPGGAGGVRWETGVAASGTVPVEVGAGGAGRTGSTGSGTAGGDSSFGAIEATGGGEGTSASGTAGGGGSGAGGGAGDTTSQPGGSGTIGQGNDGGTGNASVTTSNQHAGGGGGAGAVGGNAGNSFGGDGGDGTDLSAEVGTQLGDDGWFGGGGGGGKRTASGGDPGDGGRGGGGDGQANGTAGSDGADGTGGGGGSSGNGGNGGDGGDGIVIVRYLTL